MNKFEQQKKVAFSALSWLLVVSVITTIVAVVYKSKYATEWIVVSWTGMALLTLWLNHMYFSMPKAFYRIDAKWRACKSRLDSLETIKTKITKNPSLIAHYMLKWGYKSETLFKMHLAEELVRCIQKEAKITELLNEIKTTPETSLVSYIQANLWR